MKINNSKNANTGAIASLKYQSFPSPQTDTPPSSIHFFPLPRLYHPPIYLPNLSPSLSDLLMMVFNPSFFPLPLSRSTCLSPRLHLCPCIIYVSHPFFCSFPKISSHRCFCLTCLVPILSHSLPTIPPHFFIFLVDVLRLSCWHNLESAVSTNSPSHGTDLQPGHALFHTPLFG